ncbi:MBL fold metallo-hydrolase [Opitutaceae bacterium TAV4]|nr:MBL fold metallo-hydrolase [Opitutaceae bacterium TAV3]RRK01531.1 MBL fold metallo-hydrolase [Opitutaceae bacterium TAV4]
MKLHVIPAGPIRTNAYLLTQASSGEAILIDAPEGVWADVAPILQKENCKLRELWLTHGHWDHMQGGAEVVEKSGALVRAHEDDRVLIETPEVMDGFLGPGVPVRAMKIDAVVTQGDRLRAFGIEAEVRHVPGHCPGNVLFYFAPMGAAFVGDALFAGSVGRTDLPGGSSEQLARSVRTQIYTLPNETQVFPGHGGPTTVGKERESNPFVRG